MSAQSDSLEHALSKMEKRADAGALTVLVLTSTTWRALPWDAAAAGLLERHPDMVAGVYGPGVDMLQAHADACMVERHAGR